MKWLDRAAVAMAFVAGAALLLVAAVTLADVSMRYLFLRPLLSAPDILQVTMPVVVMLALPLATRADSHIAVDLFASLGSARVNAIRDALIKVALAGLSLVLAWGCWERSGEAALFGEATNMVALPFAPIFAIMTIGCAANAVLLVAEAAFHLAGLALPPAPQLAPSPDEENS